MDEHSFHFIHMLVKIGRTLNVDTWIRFWTRFCDFWYDSLIRREICMNSDLGLDLTALHVVTWRATSAILAPRVEHSSTIPAGYGSRCRRKWPGRICAWCTR